MIEWINELSEWMDIQSRELDSFPEMNSKKEHMGKMIL